MSDFLRQVKENRRLVTMIGFCVIALAMILIGILALKENVVPVCILIIIEAAIAVMLHKAELWVHGVLVLAEIIAGILTGNIGLIILCIVVYIAATYTLKTTVIGENE